MVAVAEENHFGRAALRCHVSQPALSGQIRKLEDSLGVILFERTKRTVRITPIGEQVLIRARQVIALSDEIVATAQSARSPLSGSFRLGMISTIAPYLSPMVLPAISEELPDLSLTLVESQTIDLESRIADGKLDAALLATPLRDSHFKSIALYEEPFWVALSPGHPLAKQKTIDLKDIAPEQLLLLADGHCLRDQVLNICQATQRAQETTNANTRETSLETLLALVAAGDGVTLVPALSRPHEGQRRNIIETRREATGAAGRIVRLVYRGSYPGSELLNRLASVIRTNVPETMVRVLT